MATKDELQDELEARGLPTSGTKSELEDRLAEDDAAQEGEQGEEEGPQRPTPTNVANTNAPSDQPVRLGVRDGVFHYTFVVDNFPESGSDQDVSNRAETERQAINFGWVASGPAAEAYRDEVPGGGGDLTYACPVVENTREGKEGLDYSPGDGPYPNQDTE